MNDSNKKIFSEHAKEQMPFEACALLIIEKGIEKIILCKNIADNKKNQFIICPDDYVLAESRGQVSLWFILIHFLHHCPATVTRFHAKKPN